MKPRFLGLLATVGALATLSTDARAFSTRVHIMIANDLHDAAASGDGAVTLWQGEHAVVLTEDDARAIIAEPEAFRAGASARTT